MRVVFDASSHEREKEKSLAEKDSDAVRVLWFTGPPSGEGDAGLRVLRMTRVVFGASPSPFLLAATIRKHLGESEREQPQVAGTLRESLYVDGFIASSPDLEEAYFLTTTAKTILSTAGMDLSKWMTNSPELKKKWEESALDHTHGDSWSSAEGFRFSVETGS